MSNYSKKLARDVGGAALTGSPAPFLAKARYTGENASSSSVISVTDDTTEIEVAAVTTAAAMRWVTTADTQASVVTVAGATANYDHIIPVSTVRRFTIPQESSGTSSIVGSNVKYGLYRRFAVKSMGIGSVLSAEY